MKFGNNMSRVGRKPIEIPQGVEVQIDGQKVTVKGPKGELSRTVLSDIAVTKSDTELVVAPREKEYAKQVQAFWGLERSLLSNLVSGVTEGFEKRLEIQGVGYRAVIEGENIVLSIGFSHPVPLSIPEGVTVSVEKNIIVVSGIDKGKVTGFAAKIKRQKPPEPYKGKGIRYEGEVVRRKLGKRAIGSEGV